MRLTQFNVHQSNGMLNIVTTYIRPTYKIYKYAIRLT